MFRIQYDVTLRRVGDDYLAYNPYTNETVVVNEFAFILLQELANESLSLESIVDGVRKTWINYSNELTHIEFEETLKLLTARGLVVCSETRSELERY